MKNFNLFFNTYENLGRGVQEYQKKNYYQIQHFLVVIIAAALLGLCKFFWLAFISFTFFFKCKRITCMER